MSWSGVPERLEREWSLTDQERALFSARKRWERFAETSGHGLDDVGPECIGGLDDVQRLTFGFDRDRLLPEFTD